MTDQRLLILQHILKIQDRTLPCIFKIQDTIFKIVKVKVKK